MPVVETYTENALRAGLKPTLAGGGNRTVKSMSTVLGAIWTNRQMPKTFCENSSSFIPGKSDFARIVLVVDAIDEERGRGDSKIETAAVERVPMEEVPRTMTCRWVDLSAW